MRCVIDRRIEQLTDLSFGSVPLPGFVRQGGNLFHQAHRLIGGDRVDDPLSFAKLDQPPGIKLTVGAQIAWQVRWRAQQRLLQKPNRFGCRSGVARLQMGRQHLPFFRPKGEQQVVTNLAFVVEARPLFASRALDVERSIQIDSDSIAPLPLPHPLSSQAIDSEQITQLTDLKLTQKLASRGRRHQRGHAEQLGQAGIAEQDIEIEQTTATENGIPTQTQNILRFQVAARLRFEMKLVVKQLWQAKLSYKVAQEYDASFAGQSLSAETDIEMEGFAKYSSIH
jgi:hypothetical protein